LQLSRHDAHRDSPPEWVAQLKQSCICPTAQQFASEKEAFYKDATTRELDTKLGDTLSDIIGK
jgi:hypothetical protein